LHNILRNDKTTKGLTAQKNILEERKMQKKPLTELFNELGQEMVWLGYLPDWNKDQELLACLSALK